MKLSLHSALLIACGLAMAWSTPLSAHADDPTGLKALARDPNSPEAQAEKAAAKARIAREKAMRQIRFKYFRAQNNNAVRQEGILQMRAFNDPAAYKSLIDIFQDQGEDVQRGFLDMFVEAKTDEGDAALAWCGIFGKDQDFRQRAVDRLKSRSKEAKGVSNKVKLVIFNCLRSQNEDAITHSAVLSEQLGLLEAIPHLIPAQVGRTPNPSGDRVGDMAWIAVGTQTAFVSDLTPVVSQSSAAFDPTLSVVTDGALLRVQDATVTTVYRPLVAAALQRLGSSVTNQDLKRLGYDMPRWWDWYKNTYLPAKAELDEKAKQDGKSSPATPPGGG